MFADPSRPRSPRVATQEEGPGWLTGWLKKAQTSTQAHRAGPESTGSWRGRVAAERSGCVGEVSTTIAAPSSALSLIARALRAPTEAPPEVVVDTSTFGISVDAALPASTYQEHFALLHLLQPRTPAYAMPMVLELSSAYRQPLVRAALQLLVRRHAVLRTFYAVDGSDYPEAQLVTNYQCA